ncbi:hypothetical protein M422DRAFT_776468 [Sphaerobolus stellatus SS14]|nr:hypothetical protein M422DRAFT_776468 [Sphaerobolus stellatus SS14]
MLSSRNADVPRALVHDIGSVGLDNKFFSFWALQRESYPFSLPLPRLIRNRPLRKRHKGKRVSAPLLPPPLRAHSAPQRIRIMTIVPRDFSIFEDIEPIHGVPYRTMDAFLHGISESKDDTIDERTSLGRPADETSNFKLTVPSDLDVSIWSDVDTHHTACGAKESAYERRGRAYFTEHLLDSF